MEVGTFQEKLQRVLMAYRNTPHTTTGITPAKLLLGRKPKTLSDLAKLNIAERVRRKQSEQKQHHDNRLGTGHLAHNKMFMSEISGLVLNGFEHRFENSTVLYRLLAGCRMDIS